MSEPQCVHYGCSQPQAAYDEELCEKHLKASMQPGMVVISVLHDTAVLVVPNPIPRRTTHA